MLLHKDKSALLIIDVQQKLSPLVLDPQSMILRCQWLEKLAVKMNVPILLSEQYPSGLGETAEPLRSIPEVEDCISKVSFSCMQEPVYIERLNKLEKTQLVLAGIEAHVCVLQTAIELKEVGYEVFVVVDAVSSRKEMDLKYGLKRMKQAGIHLVTAEMVFFEWIKKAGTPEFKALSKEFLR